MHSARTLSFVSRWRCTKTALKRASASFSSIAFWPLRLSTSSCSLFLFCFCASLSDCALRDAASCRCLFVSSSATSLLTEARPTIMASPAMDAECRTCLCGDVLMANSHLQNGLPCSSAAMSRGASSTHFRQNSERLRRSFREALSLLAMWSCTISVVAAGLSSTTLTSSSASTSPGLNVSLDSRAGLPEASRMRVASCSTASVSWKAKVSHHFVTAIGTAVTLSLTTMKSESPGEYAACLAGGDCLVRWAWPPPPLPLFPPRGFSSASESESLSSSLDLLCEVSVLILYSPWFPCGSL
mmetsp:Transcript_53672/g.129945  ORF Transcript_53672/g.129945 Transcript_53672/m.129945 type:complete len:299 (-) Transcript_53672:103-999(-)